EVIEDRAGLRSTIITSQLPISMWHEAMGEPTVADAVLDRVLANLHRIELEGESMRRPEGTPKAAGEAHHGPARAKGARTSPAPGAASTGKPR
ncbi:MAG: ATP-binding protein, partial [Acidimicrobiales bacterium]